MTFQSPAFLWLLLVVGAALGAEMALAARSVRAARRFATPDMLDLVAPRRPGARRVVTTAGLLVTLLLLVLASARPATTVEVPRNLSTVIVALDASTSMGATDVHPSRLRAAQAAAEQFVRRLSGGPLVGYVEFAGTSAVDVPPTYNRFAVAQSIGDTRLASGTAIGDAIASSIDAIAFTVGLPDVDSPKARPRPLPPSAVVLLSDGDTNAGRPTEVAAALAKRYGVPVSTIAYGTLGGTAVINGLVQSVPVNAAALRAIARTTGGRFFRATSSRELANVYRAVHSDIGFRTEYRDVTLWFGAAAFVLALLTGAVSLAWFSRLP